MNIEKIRKYIHFYSNEELKDCFNNSNGIDEAYRDVNQNHTLWIGLRHFLKIKENKLYMYIIGLSGITEAYIDEKDIIPYLKEHLIAGISNDIGPMFFTAETRKREHEYWLQNDEKEEIE